MIDIFPEDIIVERLKEHFGVLAEGYIEDMAKDLISDLSQYVSDYYDTKYMIINIESGEPVSRATFNLLSDAETYAAKLKADVAILLIPL